MLRYIAWLCLRDDKLKGSQMCIVTGPRIDLAITLVERIKGLGHNRKSRERMKTKYTRGICNSQLQPLLAFIISSSLQQN